MRADDAALYGAPSSRRERERAKLASLTPEERERRRSLNAAKARRWNARNREERREYENPPRDKPPEYYEDRNALRWEDDEVVQEIVAAHPGGLSLGDVAYVFGCSRERIRQIEEEAIAKIQVALGHRLPTHFNLQSVRLLIEERGGEVSAVDVAAHIGGHRHRVAAHLHACVKRGQLSRTRQGHFGLPDSGGV